MKRIKAWMEKNPCHSGRTMLHGLKQLCRQDAAARSFTFTTSAGGCAGPSSISRVCMSLSSPSSSSSERSERAVQTSFPTVSSVCEAHASGQLADSAKNLKRFQEVDSYFDLEF
jgi:hypothetical protein